MTASIALPPLRPDVRRVLDDAVARTGAERAEALRELVRLDPLCLDAWAGLSDSAYESSDDVASYAFARVGYHRGLDQLRAAGWRPDLEVRWEHEPNRGFLRSLFGLMRAAAAIGEGAEGRRCREFLLELDPTDPLAVGAIQPKDLSRRLPGR